MIGVVFATHARLAESLLDNARGVVANATRYVAVEIREGDTTESYEKRLREAVVQVGGANGVLLLTDMFGGTPSNVGLTLHKVGSVEVLTGANLPMAIKALQLSVKDVDLATAARQVKEAGQRSIAVASEVLGGQTKESAG
ncbi:MAG: PTS fructose transporter subunit IIA [Clostridia bacterium]|nr:PTS fructose transporter subunit IIA [Deltaproteobacteria bacterium]